MSELIWCPLCQKSVEDCQNEEHQQEWLTAEEMEQEDWADYSDMIYDDRE